MITAPAETITEVFHLELSAEDVEALLRAMAAVDTPSPVEAKLEVIDLTERRRGPFAMPAVAA